MKLQEIAKQTGCSIRTIQLHAHKLGFRQVMTSGVKRGGQNLLTYDLTASQVKQLVACLHYKRGRPKVVA